MSLIMLAEHYFTHKINHHVILPSFQIEVRKQSKSDHKKDQVISFSYSTANPNLLYMRSEDCK